MHSGFQALHPLLAFLYYIGVLTFSMLFTQPVFLLTALIVVSLLWLIVGKGKPKGKLLLFYLLIAAMVAIVNPIFSHRGATILFYFLDQPITMESITYGLIMALTLLIILIAFQSYNLVLSSDKLTYLFGSLVPRATLVLIMTLRFLPLLYRRWQQVVHVQYTQGILFGQGNLRTRLKQGMQLLSILVTWSLEEAIQTAQSMRARGYGLGKRSSYRRYRLRDKDLFLLFYLVVTAGISLWGQLAGHGVLTIYPRLGSVVLSHADWFYFVSFSAFITFPLWLEGREFFRWHVFKSSNYPLPIQQQQKNP